MKKSKAIGSVDIKPGDKLPEASESDMISKFRSLTRDLRGGARSDAPTPPKMAESFVKTSDLKTDRNLRLFESESGVKASPSAEVFGLLNLDAELQQDPQSPTLKS